MKNVHGEGHSVQSIPIVNGSLASNSSTTEDDMYTDDEMEGEVKNLIQTRKLEKRQRKKVAKITTNWRKRTTILGNLY